jgi:hypothetical protein
LAVNQLTPTGFEGHAATGSQDNDLRDFEQVGAAQSGAAGFGTSSQGAATDPELGRVIEAWPRLSAEVKARVLALVTREATPPIP